MSPLFTIATITYNSSQWVRQTIESVLASSFTNFEFIISDDGSSDDTWDIIQSYQDERIVASRNKHNIGEYANRNKVLAEATGQYIFYIDGDDMLCKNSLELLHDYLTFFDDVSMVWGVSVSNIDFAVLPYRFTPEQITSLIYFTHLPLSTLGLGETIFNVQKLRSIGGFDTRYAIGDTYVKRKLATIGNVLLVPEGLSFWRRSANQASQHAAKNLRSFVDMCNINSTIVNGTLPLTESDAETARENTRITAVKLLVSNTLLKGNLAAFFKLKRQLSIPIGDFLLLLKKGWYGYKPVADVSRPLLNEYHFTSNIFDKATLND
jgi:glycosyltransferase involved in cell wall biosynthesis